MPEPLEQLYFGWLRAKVLRVQNPTPSLTYDILFKTLFETEFAWQLSGDDNRAADGKELRREFLIAADLPDDEDWRRNVPCSVFEMLIAFSRRLEFQDNRPVEVWFWEMITNLGLDRANDASGVTPYEIQDTLDIFIWRQYPYNGDGGLFPMDDPSKDQREVEIWYQFCEYFISGGGLDRL
jgi:hypothetical protein